jgi:hypothetical protein
MTYAKSLLAGLGALIAYCFLFFTFGVRLLRLLLPMPRRVGRTDLYVLNLSWVPLIRLWVPLVIGVLVFAAAYFWTFKRLSRAKPQRR